MTGNKMSSTQLTLLTALNMLGSGIIMLPAKLAEVGMISSLSWIFAATGPSQFPMSLLVAACFRSDRDWEESLNMPSAIQAHLW